MGRGSAGRGCTNARRGRPQRVRAPEAWRGAGAGGGARISSVTASPGGRLGRRRIPASPPALCSVPAGSLPRSVKGPAGPAPAGAGGVVGCGAIVPSGGGGREGPRGSSSSGASNSRGSPVSSFFSPTKRKPNETSPRHGSKVLCQVSFRVAGVLSQSSSAGLSAYPHPVRGLFCCLPALVSKTKPLRRLRATCPALSPPCTRRVVWITKESFCYRIIGSQENSGWKGPQEIAGPTSCSKQGPLSFSVTPYPHRSPPPPPNL